MGQVSGIYCMYFNTDDSKYYIGMSSNIEKRVADHYSMLKGNKHTNNKIQDLYNKYHALPLVEVLEYVAIDQLVEREVYWIKEFDSFNNGLNKSTGGEKYGVGELNPLSHYSDEEYKEVLFYIASTNEPLVSIAEITGVSYYVVRDISCGKAHSYLSEKYPELWEACMLKSGTRSSKIYLDSIYISIMEEIAYTTKSYKKISEDLKVNYQIVRNIAYGSSHKYLQTEYPDVYKLMQARRMKNIGGIWKVV